MSSPAKIEAALKRYRTEGTDAHYRTLKVTVRSWLETLRRKLQDGGGAVDVGRKLLEGTDREVDWP